MSWCNFFLNKLAIVFFGLVLSTNGWSQYSFKLSSYVGIGIPEMLHGGLKLNINNWHIDGSVGGWLGGDQELSAAFGGAYHFGELGKFGQIPYTYVYLGGIYTTSDAPMIRTRDIFLVPRIGSDIHIIERLYLSISMGIGINLYHVYENDDPEHVDGDPYMPIIPSGQFSLVYTLLKSKRN